MVSMWQKLELGERIHGFQSGDLGAGSGFSFAHFLTGPWGHSSNSSVSGVLSVKGLAISTYASALSNIIYSVYYNKYNVLVFVFTSDYITLPRILLG